MTDTFAALGIGLFNSIMFPVIFTLTLERSSASKEATSGFLCFAIVGGAFVPLLVGAVSGATSYATAFVVPAACYLVLLVFGLAAAGAKVATVEHILSALAGLGIDNLTIEFEQVGTSVLNFALRGEDGKIC